MLSRIDSIIPGQQVDVAKAYYLLDMFQKGREEGIAVGREEGRSHEAL